MITLETERLHLRMWKPGDFEPYVQIFAEPAIGQFLEVNGQPLNRHEAWRSLAVQIGHWHLHGFGMFAVVERSTGDFVGRIGALQPEGWPDFELGWALSTRYWGRGYATEAVQACIRWAFSDLQKLHLISVIDPDNANSIRVAERVGETLEGTTSLPHLPGKPLLQYGLHKRDWSG
jgi:RimJ/RimL family protein N-acetyltransferase